VTLKQLADIAKKRLVHNHHSMAGDRRLVAMTRDTRRKLAAVAKALSAEVGFYVFPMQVAALLVEEMTRGLE
jgi:hypothetical protein